MQTQDKLQKPVFIVSTGRSGSNMIALVLAEHPSICAFHELKPHLKLEAFKKWPTKQPGKWFENRIRHKRSDIIQQVTSNGLIYLESAFYLSFLIPELYKLYDAKFIHIYRDGRFFVRSALAKGWYKKESFKYSFKTWLRRRLLMNIGHQKVDKELKPPKSLTTRFEKSAWLWAETNKVILDRFSSIPGDASFSLSLEGFNQKTLIDLLDFIGVPAEPSMVSRMHKIANQKPNKSKKFTSPSVSEWSDSENKRFNEIAGDMMIKLGYTSL